MAAFPGRTPMLRRRVGIAACAVALGGGGPRALVAQTPPGVAPATAAPDPRRVVAGEVVHAESGTPIEGAAVLLLPAAPDGARVGASDTAPAPLRRARSDARGRYAFAGVAPGHYELRIARVGFRPATVEVALLGDGARVSVGLAVAPVVLHPVDVTAARTGEAYARRARDAHAVADARALALRERRARYLASDVREVTHADVDDALTAGETDLFRALHRLPGVATRSDATAELWTRGGRWDQTRVTWDGLPLFNPLHTGGVLSAVNADAVGGALLFPGVRPAAMGEGGAGVLALRSRPGGGAGAVRGVGELSLLTARAALDQTVAGGRGAWMVAARRSYLDVVAGRLSGDSASQLPYHIGEVAARGDWRLGRAHTLVLSAFRSRDQTTGDSLARDGWPAAEWGNAVAQVTLAGPATLPGLGRTRLRHTAGVSAYRADVVFVDSSAPPSSGYHQSPVRAAITYATLGAELEPDASSGTDGWTLGYAAVVQRARMAGRLGAVYAADVLDTTARGHGGTLPLLALWGERRLTPSPRLAVALGVRAEIGPAVRGAGAVRPAPRLTARYTLGRGDPATGAGSALTVGVGRHVQYVQGTPALADAAARSVVLRPLPNWTLADGDVPALRTDLATAGLERVTPDGWNVTANAYLRRSAGLLVPDARPGPAVDRALAVAGTGQACGVELGARRLVGRWTGHVNYSYARATIGAPGWRAPAPEDQRHLVNAVTAVRFGRGVRIGAAYTGHAGAPFTRAALATLGVDSAGTYTLLTPFTLGRPGAGRLPAFHRLDLSADWSFAVRRVRAGFYLQVLNATAHQNVLGYAGPRAGPAGCPAGGAPDTGCGAADRFLAGIPVLPLAGARASF